MAKVEVQANPLPVVGLPPTTKRDFPPTKLVRSSIPWKNEQIKAIAKKVLNSTQIDYRYFHSAISFQGKYTICRILEEGSFGVAILAKKTSNPRSAVVIKISKSRFLNAVLEGEAKALPFLNRVDPDHTVKFIEAKTASTNIFRSKMGYTRSLSPRTLIVSEYGGQEVGNVLVHNPVRHGFSDFMHLFSQGIAYWINLSKNRLIQRDIKPYNMLIQGPFEAKGSLKFIDPSDVGKEGENGDHWYQNSRFFRSHTTLLKKYTRSEIAFAMSTSFYSILTGKHLFVTSHCRESEKGNLDERIKQEALEQQLSMQKHLQVVFDMFGFPDDQFFEDLPKDVFSKFFVKTKSTGVSGCHYKFKKRIPGIHQIKGSSKKRSEVYLERFRASINKALRTRFKVCEKDRSSVAKDIEEVFRALITDRSITPQKALEMNLFQKYQSIVQKHTSDKSLVVRISVA